MLNMAYISVRQPLRYNVLRGGKRVTVTSTNMPSFWLQLMARAENGNGGIVLLLTA